MRRAAPRIVAAMYRRGATSILLALLLILSGVGVAEYADVVLNRNSDREEVRPVIFPHWFHRIRYQCRVCHNELGFEMRVGTTPITMESIINGRYCGACHNGDIAWSPDNCNLCHSALPGTRTGVRRGHQTMGPGIW